jgi:alanine racemase
MSQCDTGGRLIIDLRALAANWQHVATQVYPARCAAVVKADAYGLGIGPVVKALQKVGANCFFVAHLREAKQVKSVAADTDVYVLNGIPPGSASLYAAAGVRPVLNTMDDVSEWQRTGLGCPAALQINTGMNRLGVTPAEAATLASEGFSPSLVMSHLACADTPKHAMNKSQLERFINIRSLFDTIPASLANSAASLGISDFHFDLCRPGVALYGGSPFAHHLTSLKEVVRLEARVIQVSQVQAGQCVGYGNAGHTRRDSKIATLSVGYADGILRSSGSRDAKNGGGAMWKGVFCPFIGRISMDLITVDVTDAPVVTRGDWLTVLGEGITINDLAASAGTIPYEILTSLGQRYHRSFSTDL